MTISALGAARCEQAGLTGVAGGGSRSTGSLIQAGARLG